MSTHRTWPLLATPVPFPISTITALAPSEAVQQSGCPAQKFHLPGSQDNSPTGPRQARDRSSTSLVQAAGIYFAVLSVFEQHYYVLGMVGGSGPLFESHMGGGRAAQKYSYTFITGRRYLPFK